MYVEGLNVLNHKNAWFMDADLVGDGAGPPRVQEEPSGVFRAS